MPCISLLWVIWAPLVNKQHWSSARSIVDTTANIAIQYKGMFYGLMSHYVCNTTLETWESPNTLFGISIGTKAVLRVRKFHMNSKLHVNYICKYAYIYIYTCMYTLIFLWLCHWYEKTLSRRVSIAFNSWLIPEFL